MLRSELPGNCRVMLVDDHNLVRVALRRLLERMNGIEVVGEADDGDVAVARALQLRPDVVLMDISMRVMDGLEALIQLRQSTPDVRVMMLSMHDGQDIVMQALRSGACGYLLKDAEEVELELALRAAMRGERYLSPPISRRIVDRLLELSDKGPEPEEPRDPEAGLTRRQLQILGLIARGMATKEIAYELGVSIKTVETHRAHIMRRLKIHDIAGLVLYAVRQGLVPLE